MSTEPSWSEPNSPWLILIDFESDAVIGTGLVRYFAALPRTGEFMQIESQTGGSSIRYKVIRVEHLVRVVSDSAAPEQTRVEIYLRAMEGQ